MQLTARQMLLSNELIFCVFVVRTCDGWKSDERWFKFEILNEFLEHWTVLWVCVCACSRPSKCHLNISHSLSLDDSFWSNTISVNCTMNKSPKKWHTGGVDNDDDDGTFYARIQRSMGDETGTGIARATADCCIQFIFAKMIFFLSFAVLSRSCIIEESRITFKWPGNQLIKCTHMYVCTTLSRQLMCAMRTSIGEWRIEWKRRSRMKEKMNDKEIKFIFGQRLSVAAFFISSFLLAHAYQNIHTQRPIQAAVRRVITNICENCKMKWKKKEISHLATATVSSWYSIHSIDVRMITESRIEAQICILWLSVCVCAEWKIEQRENDFWK